ncbi:unnamed protein product [Adineta steineri]|uniref:G-protein coupled receptors family 1 profile domain-containing protein n=1 Tax=Adineta steineri TaxID=433720 RepID=A0A813UE96_9BILA|nr:unnamed protein product [Adineta steineri]
MSSADGSLTSLQSIQTNLYRIGGPILLVLGVISCIINLIVFTQKNLRKSPCSIYLIAANIANLLYITIPVLFVILTTGYGIDVFSANLFICRFYYYISYLFEILSPFYLILASIDRVLVTSTNARTRQKSTPRLAYICIGCGTLLWMLFHCHALILTDIQEIAPGLFLCYPRAGPYVVFMGYYSMFVKAIAVPLLMIIFGTWTANNIRKVRQRRIAPVIMNNGNTARNSERSFNSKDRQFVLMVVVDICIYVACTAMISASVDRVLVTSSNARTRQRSTRRLAYICIGCGTLFWMLFHCHTLILVDIEEIAPGYFTCYFRAGPYVVFMGYYSLFVKAIAVPLLLIVFAIWTAKNIRKVRRRRIAPVTTNTRNTAGNSEQPFHSKDRQFVLMVVVDICIYVACNAMVFVVVIYYQIAQNTGLTQISIFLSLVGSFLSDISYCVGCYAYLFISKTFRKEVKRLFFCQ